ncbi:hypothetical protein [Nocardioides lacusdianchii]|uniref:hypothetical protein n=1 Tax=Nocardioides lacusdianchii TaxID=2783664 RepID=UPI001CCF2425|nr:hypothetical protein [Nocardioides lacusdianchii]
MADLVKVSRGRAINPSCISTPGELPTIGEGAVDRSTLRLMQIRHHSLKRPGFDAAFLWVEGMRTMPKKIDPRVKGRCVR